MNEQSDRDRDREELARRIRAALNPESAAPADASRAAPPPSPPPPPPPPPPSTPPQADTAPAQEVGKAAAAEPARGGRTVSDLRESLTASLVDVAAEAERLGSEGGTVTEASGRRRRPAAVAGEQPGQPSGVGFRGLLVAMVVLLAAAAVVTYLLVSR